MLCAINSFFLVHLVLKLHDLFQISFLVQRVDLIFCYWLNNYSNKRDSIINQNLMKPDTFFQAHLLSILQPYPILLKRKRVLYNQNSIIKKTDSRMYILFFKQVIVIKYHVCMPYCIHIA